MVRSAAGAGWAASTRAAIRPPETTMWASWRPSLLTTVALAMTSSGWWDIGVLLGFGSCGSGGGLGCAGAFLAGGEGRVQVAGQALAVLRRGRGEGSGAVGSGLQCGHG